MGTPADHIIETAKQAGAGLEAMQARKAMADEARLKVQLAEAQAITDSTIVALLERAGGGLTQTAVGVLLGIPDRQTIHRRVKRYHEKKSMEADQ